MKTKKTAEKNCAAVFLQKKNNGIRSHSEKANWIAGTRKKKKQNEIKG